MKSSLDKMVKLGEANKIMFRALQEISKIKESSSNKSNRANQALIKVEQTKNIPSNEGVI